MRPEQPGFRKKQLPLGQSQLADDADVSVFKVSRHAAPPVRAGTGQCIPWTFRRCSERNFVVKILACRILAALVGRRRARTCIVVLATQSSSTAPAVQHCQFTSVGSQHDLCRVAVVAGLILPFPGLELPLDIYLRAFGKVLLGNANKTFVENRNPMPFSPLATLSRVAILPSLGRRNTKVAALPAILERAHFRILPQVAYQNDLVYRTCHVTSPRSNLAFARHYTHVTGVNRHCLNCERSERRLIPCRDKSDAGAFRLRAAVVGSLAFQFYVPMLVFMTPGAVSRTGDVDVGQIPAILIAVQNRIEPDLLSVLKTADSRFEAVPSPFDPRSILRYAIRDGSQERFAVDILAPLRGPPRDRPVHLPALGRDAQPLRFLDFLVYQEIEAVVLHGPGIPVKVPAPERFAVHKLLVASRRRPNASGRDKARKDLAQADILCRVLVRDRPDDLIDAWNEFLDRGPAWRAAVAQSWKMLPDKVKEVLPSPDVPGTATKPYGNVDEGPSL